ncbi:hypothetical protein KVR01_003354 [Diaporthe batatas]|uniref:uncharacterized protein n=1 Tax=Diaporthe batatas TaxID=748121 RepID=UPI001D051AC8|nr:uncharacterized protein KVR01_003354 [Diaporthe batatas]KAG8167665.1 hypothetical protein KVR01_003354 [Diaporthe batatas]
MGSRCMGEQQNMLRQAAAGISSLEDIRGHTYLFVFLPSLWGLITLVSIINLHPASHLPTRESQKYSDLQVTPPSSALPTCHKTERNTVNMGAVMSCIQGIGDCIMTVIRAIAGVIMSIVNGVVAVLSAIVRFLTCGYCGRGGGGTRRTRHTSHV